MKCTYLSTTFTPIFLYVVILEHFSYTFSSYTQSLYVLQFTEAVLMCTQSVSESIMCTFGSSFSIAVPKKYLIECIIGM